ncbi:MAG TPA: glucose-6-phosphate dehydrogenase [Acidimicrobiales bacterium]|nr:glucose-6-phosphate dehydrogenase [Acidimicrobiales bacterium]
MPVTGPREPGAAGAAADPQVIVLFGATGDLARRKLLPALVHLDDAGLIPEFRVIGTSLDDFDDDEFRRFARKACEEFCRSRISDEQWARFLPKLHYVPIAAGADGLQAAVAAVEAELGPPPPRRLHYLSIPPSAATSVVQMLGDAGLAERARIIMEKPFGSDLPSARALNADVHRFFDDHQVFRIDHFLGKEAAQNILAFRFANGLFEPIWNRDHIDHVQIDVPETLSVGGRAGFYESTGAYSDMVVTHLFQILGFVAMEPPTALEPRAISEEKDKVFRSLQPVDPAKVVRGQYEGYRQEPGVSPGSQTETFVALEVAIDNWRWAGVPFFLRTGKRMAEGARIISIAFREPPKSMFPAGSGVGTKGPDHLTFDLADQSRLSLSFYGKRPGPGMRLEKLSMQFALQDTGQGGAVLEAYERLIHDAMTGDQTLFTSAEGIERLWEVSTPLLQDPPKVKPYWQGSWGPDGVEQLISPREWRLPFRRGWRATGA